jgi:FkbM family methyltransferase
LTDGEATVQAQLRDFGRVLRDVRGQRPRASLVFRWLGSRAGSPDGWLKRTFGGRIRIPFRSFEADFELSQGEIAPYAQMVRDRSEGVIPVGPQVREWTVVDCGANVGLFSLFLKDAARVVAVEPNPAVNRRLKKNLETNGVAATVIEAAISNRDGTVRMDFASGPSVLSSIGESGAEVRSISLDSLLSEAEIDSVDLLKLDLEGHEIDALSGGADALRKGRIKRIVAEFSDAEALAALDEHLAAFGLHRVTTGRINARFEL